MLTPEDRKLIDDTRQLCWREIMYRLIRTRRLTADQAGEIATSAAMDVDRHLVALFDRSETPTHQEN